MKKNNPFILFLLFVLVGTTSCNKTWNCVCSERGKILSVIPVKTLGKMGAKNVCDSYQEQNRINGGNQICVIK